MSILQNNKQRSRLEASPAPDLYLSMAIPHSVKVGVGVLVGLTVAALPLMNSKVRAREEAVAKMRDEQYDQKDVARTARLSIKSDR